MHGAQFVVRMPVLPPPPRPTTDDLVRIMAADTYVRTSWGGRWVRGRRRRRRRLHSSRQSAACICNCFAIIMRAMHGTKRNASLAVSVKLVRATAAPTYIRGLGFHRRTSRVKAAPRIDIGISRHVQRPATYLDLLVFSPAACMHLEKSFPPPEGAPFSYLQPFNHASRFVLAH
jgi:hypothetical protein